jgi:hypothetical protein
MAHSYPDIMTSQTLPGAQTDCYQLGLPTSLSTHLRSLPPVTSDVETERRFEVRTTEQDLQWIEKR